MREREYGHQQTRTVYLMNPYNTHISVDLLNGKFRIPYSYSLTV